MKGQMEKRYLDRLFAIVAECLEVGADEVNLQSTPDTIANWDSVRQLNIILSLEEEFKVQFTPTEFARIDSVNSIASLLEAKLGPAST